MLVKKEVVITFFPHFLCATLGIVNKYVGSKMQLFSKKRISSSSNAFQEILNHNRGWDFRVT